MKMVSLEQATLRFHVLTHNGTEHHAIRLWAGAVSNIEVDDINGTVIIDASGLRAGMMLPFPARNLQSTCPLKFKGEDGKCGYAGTEISCDKSLERCTALNNQARFQGFAVPPTSPINNPAKKSFTGAYQETAVTTASPFKTLYGKPIPMIYTKGKIVVDCPLFEANFTAGGTDFFEAAGIISEGPLGTDTDALGQVLLDGMTGHGFGGGQIACVKNYGNIPTIPGTHIHPALSCAGLAFASVRRQSLSSEKSDGGSGTYKGTELANHQMKAEVFRGVPVLKVWDGTGNHAVNAIGAPEWPPEIAFDIAMRAIGITPSRTPYTFHGGDAENPAQYENYGIRRACLYVLDIQKMWDACKACADKGYVFSGIIKDAKAAFDHMVEVLQNAPIDLCFRFGRMAFIFRKDETTAFSGVEYVFGENIILDTFKASKYKPQFNSLTLVFGGNGTDDQFRERDVTMNDFPFQRLVGANGIPLQQKKTMNLTSYMTADQARKYGTQLIREELGGRYLWEQLNARDISFAAPLVGLLSSLGDVVKVVHPELVKSSYARLDSNGSNTADGDWIGFYDLDENEVRYTFKAAFTETPAAGVLTAIGVPLNNNTLTIGNKQYTFKTTLSGADQILIGGNAAAMLGNIKAAINGEAGEGSTYGTGTKAHNQVAVTAITTTTLTVTALVPGADGNLIATWGIMANLSFGSGTLTGGTSPAGYEVKIGATLEATLDNLQAAVNADGDPGLQYSHNVVANPYARATYNSATYQEFMSSQPQSVSMQESSAALHWDTGNMVVDNGLRYARIYRWRYASDNYQVQISCKTVELSMYDGQVDQNDSSIAGPTIPGTPGGSGGSDGSENGATTLTSPTIMAEDITQHSARITVTSPVPDACYFLQPQLDIYDDSLTDTDPVPINKVGVTAGAAFYYVGATVKTQIWTRCRWYRTADDVGPWSDVLTVNLLPGGPGPWISMNDQYM